MINCHASIKGLFAGLIILSFTVISVILYAVFRNKIDGDLHFVSSLSTQQEDFRGNKVYSHAATLTETLSSRHSLAGSVRPLVHASAMLPASTPNRILYSIGIIEVVNLLLLLISLLTTTWALIKVRKLQYQRTATRMIKRKFNFN